MRWFKRSSPWSPCSQRILFMFNFFSISYCICLCCKTVKLTKLSSIRLIVLWEQQGLWSGKMSDAFGCSNTRTDSWLSILKFMRSRYEVRHVTCMVQTYHWHSSEYRSLWTMIADYLFFMSSCNSMPGIIQSQYKCLKNEIMSWSLWKSKHACRGEPKGFLNIFLWELSC